MTAGGWDKKLARAIQRVAEDELGGTPKYVVCLRLARAHSPENLGAALVGKTREERACLIVEANRDELRTSIEQRAAR